MRFVAVQTLGRGSQIFIVDDSEEAGRGGGDRETVLEGGGWAVDAIWAVFRWTRRNCRLLG